jgi:hypothetical protein
LPSYCGFQASHHNIEEAVEDSQQGVCLQVGDLA